MSFQSLKGSTLWRLVRPESWLQYLGLVVLGWSSDRPGGLPLLPLLWAAIYLGSGFAFNSACDAASDNPAKNPLAGTGGASGAWRRVSGGILLLCAPLAFVMTPAHPWVLASQPVAGFLYSLPGTGLKRIPVLGTLSNIWLFVPLYLAGAPGEMADRVPALVLLALPMLQSQLIHEIVDLGEDTRARTGSTAALAGTAGVRRLVAALSVVSVLFAAGAALAGQMEPLPALAMVLASLAGLAPSAEPAIWRTRFRRSFSVACLVWLGANLWRAFR